MKTTETSRWETIAARITADTAPLDGEMPYGFSTRVVSLWRAARRDEALRRWSLWSLRAALGSAAVCTLVIVFTSRQNESSILLSPPSAQFISPPLSSP
jgi:hypothetical protein